MNMQDEFKKIFLAGIGAIATTAEKSSELIDQFVKKGELTMEQGKVLNEELKRTFQKKAEDASEKTESFLDNFEAMTNEQVAALKQKLKEWEKKHGTDTDETK